MFSIFNALYYINLYEKLLFKVFNQCPRALVNDMDLFDKYMDFLLSIMSSEFSKFLM